MGCGLGKKKVVVEVDFQMEETGDSKYDSMFHDLESPLFKLQRARKKLNTAVKQFQKEVGTYKQLKNPSFFDSLMAMLFCFSTSAQGNLETISFSHSKSPPYIHLNPDLLYTEHRRILPAWGTVVTLAAKLPSKLAILASQIETALRETAVNPPHESGPDTNLDEPRNCSRLHISANQGKLAQAKNLIEEVASMARDINETVGKIGEILNDAHSAIVAIGEKAFVEQKVNPREIVNAYWPTSRSPGLSDG